MKCFFSAFVLIFAFSGCEKKEPIAATDEPADTTKESPKEAATKPPPKLKEADVNAVVQSWLKSQNDGDFDAYSKSYAEKLTGIKRVGPKKYQYDRSGWLKDRSRMFKKKMLVSIKDQKVKAASNTAVVTFEQTWESGTFKDVGPKQLVIVPTKGGLKISREEMLRSTLSKGGDKPPAYDPKKHVLVAEGRYVVLAMAAPVSWKAKSHRFIDDDSVVVSDISKTVPKALVAMADKEFVVYDDKGDRCKEKGEIGILTHAIPHLGQSEYWEEEKLTDAQIAHEIDELAGEEGRYLVVELEKCKNQGVWGHLAETKPSVFNPVELPEKTAKLVEKAWAKLPSVSRLQKDYESETGIEDKWWADGTGKPLEVRAFSNGEKVVATIAFSNGGGCGEFEGAIWAAWEVDGTTLKLLTDEKDTAEYFDPELAADTDGDGIPEFFGWKGVAQLQGTVYRNTYNTIAPYYGCPC